MRLTYLFSNARSTDGYGRYNVRLMRALQGLGVDVRPQHTEMANADGWVQEKMGVAWDGLTISCLPPFYLNKVPGRHWLLSMTEGSQLPDGWCETIQRSGVERIIVPCEHNAVVFRETGLPVHVVPGGTDPDEFPIYTGGRPERPYTFLAIADRGARKGWVEAWQAFYKAFGRPCDTPNVRMVVKSRPDGNDMLSLIAQADNPDPRITILMEDRDMSELYRSVDCFVAPSRSEGWGMPHREATMTGTPVITQAYAGLADADNWAIVVDGGKLQSIPDHFEHIAGEWLVADVTQLAAAMRGCYATPNQARLQAVLGRAWLRTNQTWVHSAKALLALIQEYYGPDN